MSYIEELISCLRPRRARDFILWSLPAGSMLLMWLWGVTLQHFMVLTKLSPLNETILTLLYVHFLVCSSVVYIMLVIRWSDLKHTQKFSHGAFFSNYNFYCINSKYKADNRLWNSSLSNITYFLSWRLLCGWRAVITMKINLIKIILAQTEEYSKAGRNFYSCYLDRGRTVSECWVELFWI